MFGLKTMTKHSGKDKTSDETDKKTKESKKCLNCLRRVDIEAVRCPQCRSSDFQY